MNHLVDASGLTWILATPLVKIRMTHPDAKVPTYAKDGDAGMDVYSVEDVESFNSGETRIVDAGFDIELSPGWECQVRSCLLYTSDAADE